MHNRTAGLTRVIKCDVIFSTDWSIFLLLTFTATVARRYVPNTCPTTKHERNELTTSQEIHMFGKMYYKAASGHPLFCPYSSIPSLRHPVDSSYDIFSCVQDIKNSWKPRSQIQVNANTKKMMWACEKKMNRATSHGILLQCGGDLHGIVAFISVTDAWCCSSITLMQLNKAEKQRIPQ